MTCLCSLNYFKVHSPNLNRISNVYIQCVDIQTSYKALLILERIFAHGSLRSTVYIWAKCNKIRNKMKKVRIRNRCVWQPQKCTKQEVLQEKSQSKRCRNAQYMLKPVFDLQSQYPDSKNAKMRVAFLQRIFGRLCIPVCQKKNTFPNISHVDCFDILSSSCKTNMVHAEAVTSKLYI